MFSRCDLKQTLKFAESLLMDSTPAVKMQRISDESMILSPNFVRASLGECCGVEYNYTPVFHPKRIHEVYALLLTVIML